MAHGKYHLTSTETHHEYPSIIKIHTHVSLGSLTTFILGYAVPRQYRFVNIHHFTKYGRLPIFVAKADLPYAPYAVVSHVWRVLKEAFSK